MVAAATEAVAAVLVLRGAPGVGRTTLLEWAAESAPAFEAVWVRCTVGEQHLRWSAAREIVRALDAALGSLIPWQHDALVGVLNGVADEPLAVGASLVALLSVAATMQPLLILIDDAQWMDPASRQALGFAARRIEFESIVMLIAEDVEAERDQLTDQLPAIEVAGLSPIDAVTLLEGKVATKVAEELALSTEGNPFAMLEIARALRPEQRSGVRALGELLPLGDVLLRDFQRRTAGLSDGQRRALEIAAANPGLGRSELRAAVTVVGVDPALADSLVPAGLLELGPDERLQFSRPLLRDAVYQSATPRDRRAAHRALAAVYTDGEEADRRAWHLSAAAEGPDPVAVRALEGLAARADGNGDALTAGRALRRAAELTDDRAQRARLLVAAGNVFALGDQYERAIAVLERALDLTGDPADQAAIQIALVGPRLAAARSPHGPVDLARLATELEGVEPTRAASLNTLAALTALSVGELHQARALCRRALDGFGAPSSRAARMAVALHALMLALSGDSDQASIALRDNEELAPEAWRDQNSVIFEDLVAEALAWIGETSASSRVIAPLVERSRETKSMVVLSRALAARADLYLRTGYWDAALADANESAELSRELGATASMVFALTVTARLEAGLGRARDASRHGREALEAAQRTGLALSGFWANGALGFLALSEGDAQAAVVSLESAREFAERQGVGLVVAVPWAPDLVEAYLRMGRRDDARRLVAQLEAGGARTQGSLSEALLERSLALVAKRGAEDHFRAAEAAHAAVLSPFERARTGLVYAEWLGRERRGGESSAKLEDAAAAFSHLGATSWHRRASAALEAQGHGPSASLQQGRSSLTPQEFRVARTVAEGATNREAAATLFLSPRTVEHHLVNVYRKLGLRSRSELARRVLSDPNFRSHLDAGSEPR